MNMRQSLFIMTVLVIALAFSVMVYMYLLPDYIQKGGPLVVILMTLSIMVVTFIFERLLTLNKAQGKGSLISFLRTIKEDISKGKIDDAIEVCNIQRGSAATVLRAGLEKYKILKSEKAAYGEKEVMDEIQDSIHDSLMLEVPLLEKNLVGLSTIASISVLVGLLGTTLGMIRAFRALAQAGAPDAIQLSVGISEALINTAGGLITAIMAIVAYNYFFTRIDNFTFMIDEASFSMIKTLAVEKNKKA
jgi:biopolymer transport protein ExbB